MRGLITTWARESGVALPALASSIKIRAQVGVLVNNLVSTRAFRMFGLGQAVLSISSGNKRAK
jgi:hypothetical protein